ncbi:MAG: ABC transporter substrate-binding protein [Deltaproteobacteria bacterium]|nr:ABC transporter substrate-binding protein [Deltaproteobacteria bacterium]
MNKRTITITAMLLIVGVGLVFYSLFLPTNQVTETPTPKYGGVYKIPVRQENSTLNPREMVWDQDKLVMFSIFDPLVRVARSAEPIPALCHNWTLEKDSTVFNCTLRKNVSFHDGKKMTVKDVLFSINYILGNGGLDIEDFDFIRGVKEFWEGKKNQISGVYAVNNDVVRFEFTKSVPSFALLLASSRIVILPEKLNGLSEKDFFNQPIGTGPFKFRKTDQKLELPANWDYYNGRPYLDMVEFLPMSDDVAIASFEKGDVHNLVFYDTEQYLEQQERDSQQVISKRASMLFLYPNNSETPFNNKTNRELLFSLIDKKQTIKDCGFESSYSDSVIPSVADGFIKKDLSGFYNLNRARKILDDKKQKNETLTPIDIYYVGYTLRKCIAEKANNNFKRLGVPWRMVETTYKDLGDLFFKGQIKVYMGSIPLDYADAYSIFRYFVSTNKENLTHINDKALDLMIGESRLIARPSDRAALYVTINERIIDHAYVYPLCELKTVLVYDKKVNITEGSLENEYNIDLAKVWLDP